MPHWLALVFAVAAQAGATQTPSSHWPPPAAPAAHEAPAVVELNNVGELTPDETLNEELRGARTAIPSEWKATFYSAFGSNSAALKSCTSSLVSKRVVLTAAHCVQDHGQIHFQVAGKSFSGRCRRHPDYDRLPRNDSADYALCLVDKAVSGVLFETIAVGADLVPVGTEVLLTGFGCTDLSGANDGVFRIGEAKVVGGPYPPRDNHVRAEGDAVVCFGDSGGPAFLIAQGRRSIVSVNSIAAAGGASRRSYLAATFTPNATSFFRSWQQEVTQQDPTADIQICGLDLSAGACR